MNLRFTLFGQVLLGLLLVSMWLPAMAQQSVVLSSMTAQVETTTGQVQIRWGTISEQNNRLFSIERSRDLLTVTEVGTVAGADKSIGQRSYSFTDPDPLPGVSYYRLRQTDHDGTTMSFRWVAVTYLPEMLATVFPNSMAGYEFRLPLLSNERARVKLANQAGKLIATDLAQADNMLTVRPKALLEAGTYVAHIEQSGVLVDRRVLVIE